MSIALTYKGEPILGVVYQPITDELFAAEKGKGATLNGVKIGVSDLAELDKAFVTIDRGKSKREKDRLVAALDVLTPHMSEACGCPDRARCKHAMWLVVSSTPLSFAG